MQHIIQSLQPLLLEWYLEKQRILPWRARKGQPKNPYHILISEFMLQQTTVKTVIDYFYRFIKKFPTLEHLAHASEDNVMHLWQGLGYYSRARNLLKCAQEIYKLGRFPNTPNDLINLPGVGPYTAASIASIAFDYPIIPIDGNVIRVFARLMELINTKEKVQLKLKEQFQNISFISEAGNFAQSIMDLGATICLPQNPLCHLCPLQNLCAAYKNQTVNQIPIKKSKVKKILFTNAYYMENQKKEICLLKNKEKGLLSGLMLPPMDPWEKQKIQPLIKNHPLFFIKQIKHIFTHIDLFVDIYKVNTFEESENYYALKDLSNLALSTLAKKIINEVKDKNFIF